MEGFDAVRSQRGEKLRRLWRMIEGKNNTKRETKGQRRGTARKRNSKRRTN